MQICADGSLTPYLFILKPGGLSGIGLGLGPGGQPIDATMLNRGGGGGGMGNMGPGGNEV